MFKKGKREPFTSTDKRKLNGLCRLFLKGKLFHFHHFTFPYIFKIELYSSVHTDVPYIFHFLGFPNMRRIHHTGGGVEWSVRW